MSRSRPERIRYRNWVLVSGSRRRRRRGGLLRIDQLAEHASEMGQRPVRGDRKHLEARVLVERGLLTLDDLLVLHEAFDQARVQRARDVRVFALEVVEV